MTPITTPTVGDIWSHKFGDIHKFYYLVMEDDGILWTLMNLQSKRILTESKARVRLGRGWSFEA